MTQFIKYQMTDDLPVYSTDIFKTRYFELVGEHIQTYARENVASTHCLVGSSKLTQAVADQLMTEFPTQIEITTPNEPSGWVYKDDPDDDS